jgi:hypothetical protein
MEGNMISKAKIKKFIAASGMIFILFFVFLFDLNSRDLEQIIDSKEPISAETYKLFTQKHKEYLSEKYFEEFQTILLNPKSENGEMKSYCLSYKVNVKSLIESAKLLVSRFKNSHLFSLGQSPAWFVEMARLLDPNSDRYGFIAFSGSWFISEDGDSTTYRSGYRVDEKLTKPGEKEVSFYRKYLAEIGLSPTAVISRYKNTGKNTVILEYSETGGGLASFLSILKAWSDELENFHELKKTLVVKLLKVDSEVERFGMIPCIFGFTVEYCSVFIKPELLDCPCDVANFCNADDFEDRLVPIYKCSNWTKIDPLKFGATRKTNLIRCRILDAEY